MDFIKIIGFIAISSLITFFIKDIQKKNKEIKYFQNRISDLEKELEFHKLIFKIKGNSAVFNLRIKTINGQKIWIDKIRDRFDRNLILSLDQDNETREWLEPVRCER